MINIQQSALGPLKQHANTLLAAAREFTRYIDHHWPKGFPITRGGFKALFDANGRAIVKLCQDEIVIVQVAFDLFS